MFAEAVLEDLHEAAFPWPTSLDKRTPSASLPGPDLVGFHRKVHLGFFFGEVKSSSESDCPPQVVASGDDCLLRQLRRLVTSSEHRQQLIQWLLVRARGTDWLPIFDEALKHYCSNPAQDCIQGVLVRGANPPNQKDLSGCHETLAQEETTFAVSLFGFYLSFNKNQWPELIYQEGATR
jgi:hypothetical protein